MAATNLPDILDPALTRPGRFDRHVSSISFLYMIVVPSPDVRGRQEILELYLQDKPLADDLTAYHESGHAIVALNTDGAHPIHKATIVPRGSALGMVTQLPSQDETSVSKKQLLARLDVCMGGRVAEELIFGEDSITTGASNDLHTATELAHYMVVKLLRDAYDRVKQLLKKSVISANNLDAEDVLIVIKEFQSLGAGRRRQPRLDINFSHAADLQITLHHAPADEGLVLLRLIESPHQ
ncbi:hypothetical protein BHE74_00012723 [Ensete ventricosum]|nr:hypothetical protein BHE74_00012723 [Ensete ventricosum]